MEEEYDHLIEVIALHLAMAEGYDWFTTHWFTRLSSSVKDRYRRRAQGIEAIYSSLHEYHAIHNLGGEK